MNHLIHSRSFDKGQRRSREELSSTADSLSPQATLGTPCLMITFGDMVYITLAKGMGPVFRVLEAE